MLTGAGVPGRQEARWVNAGLGWGCHESGGLTAAPQKGRLCKWMCLSPWGKMVGTDKCWGSDLISLHWTQRNLMGFSKGRCKVLFLGRSQPRQKDWLGANCIESSLAEKDLVVLVENKWTMRWH